MCIRCPVIWLNENLCGCYRGSLHIDCVVLDWWGYLVKSVMHNGCVWVWNVLRHTLCGGIKCVMVQNALWLNVLRFVKCIVDGCIRGCEMHCGCMHYGMWNALWYWMCCGM